MSLIFAQQILTAPFLMLDADYAALSLYAIGQLKGNNKNEPPYKPNEQPSALAVGVGGAFSKSTLDKAPKGAIAIIPIKGVMMKNDFTSWGGTLYPGAESIGQWIQQADADPNIIGIILDTDTPGGMATAGEEINGIVAATKKPVIAVYTMMASAGYYAGCSANQIISNTPSSSAGSIGTMCTIYDYSKMYAEYGITVHEIYATASIDKNKNYRDAKAGEYKGMAENDLDPINEMFMSAVTTGRAGKINTAKENVLSGKMYYTKDAKKAGLIDGDGGMAAAVKSISKLSDNQKSTNMILSKKHPVVAATLKWQEDAVSTTEGIYIQESELPILEAALTAGATATADLAVSKTALDTANATIATMTTAADVATKAATAFGVEITSLKAQVVVLGQGKSGTGSKLAVTGDAVNTGTKVAAHLDEADGANAYYNEQIAKKGKTDYKSLMD